MPSSDQISSAAVSRTSDFLESKYSKYFLIPQRYVFSLLATLILTNASSIQYSLDILALNNFILDKKIQTNDTCPFTNQTRERDHILPKNESVLVYDWGLETRYMIRDSFYWTTLLVSIPGGVLSDQFGGKYIVTLSVLFSAFTNFVAPAVIDMGKGRVGFVIMVRVCLGLFHGVLDAAIMALLARWAPIYERATMSSLIYGSRFLGEQLSHAVHKAFENFTWRPMLYFLASVHLVLGVFWHLLVYPSPAQNPFLALSEKRYLDEEPDSSLVDGWKKVPWSRILKSKALWGLCFFQIGSSWSWVVFRETLFLYMPRVLKSHAVWETAWWTPLFLYYGLALFYGFAADWFVKERHLSVTAMRKLYVLIGNFIPGLCLIFVTFERCNEFTVMVYTTISLCLDAMYFASNMVNGLDLTSNFAGTITAITGTIDFLILGSSTLLINDFFVAKDSLSQWSFLLWFSCAVEIGGAVLFLMLGSGERQSWNYIEKLIN
ncbi:sialin-like [Tribolium madens]|uniref:sialin-like n=1 Tax=Tribolium madens TaxID=41895 RepID=UPI001CF756DF|nr:sialin-like [Tribolium madens]